MQPSVAIRGHALGRCWGGVGRCILHLPLPRAAPMPRCLHHKQDSQGPGKDSGGDSLDTFIIKFQQIFIRPKEWRGKRPSVKGKGIKGPSPPSKRPYQPFTLRTQGNMSQGLGDEMPPKNVKTDSIVTGTARQVDGSEASLLSLKSEVRTDERKDRIEKEGKIQTVTSPGCDATKGVERKEVTVGEKRKLTHASHMSVPGTCAEEIHTHSSCNTAHEVLQEKETNLQIDRQTHESHTTTTTTSHGTTEVTAQHTGHTTPHTHSRESQTSETINESHLTGHTRTDDPPSDLTPAASEREVTGLAQGWGREGKGVVEEEEREMEGGEPSVARGGGGRVLSQRERALLSLVLDGVPRTSNHDNLEHCLRQDVLPSFGLLRRLCAAASESAMAGMVVHIQELARNLYPELYIKHLGLDYYWACALCHEGAVEQSLAVLLHLHRHIHPHYKKKVGDVTQFVLYRIVEQEEDEVAKAVDFVDTVATELGHLGPALSLWSATFTSPLFRMQQVSEWLVERHPRLVRSLGRRVEGLVEKAAWAGDQDLLQRILHLTLRHKMSTHYPAATSALLQLQCDEGDLRGAEETIKFAQKVEVQVTPAALHRFLALLSQHRRPAPLALLALKYRPPPARPSIPPPPTPKYRF